MKPTLFAAALVFWGLPSLASAHGTNDDPNVVHACIGNISKIVRIVGVSGTCTPAPPVMAETPVHWDIQGPPGVPGTNGINGTNGTNGINGIDGRNGIDGTNGINGADGISVTVVGTFSGNENGCANGGTTLATANGNAYICNGVNGEGGTGAARADGPCFDNDNRYVNCQNGTVTDTVTGLIWLQQADCFARAAYDAANQAAAGLKEGDCGLTDGSSPGDWRLPTKAEWEATIARAVALGCENSNAPSVTNDAGTACFNTGGSSFVGDLLSASSASWSSTTDEDEPDDAWAVDLFGGHVGRSDKSGPWLPWPVRGGRR